LALELDARDIYAEVWAMLTDGRLVKVDIVIRPGPVD
jgi:hypothetical protein